VAKNEGPYLHEWIAYHRVLGFDDILVYENESTDDSADVLANLAAHALVTPVPWSVPEDVAPQREAYIDGLARLGPDYGWVAFIDLDEFFVLPRHETIQDFLADFGHMDAIGVNWKNFGSSGHKRYKPKLVIERFTRCSERVYGRNRRVKPFARTAVIARPGTHTCKLHKPARYLDITGVPIADGRSLTVNHDTIRLHHYYTKSREEWDWKRERGRGGKAAAEPERKHWYPDFESRDRNEDVERDIGRRIKAVKALMARTAPSRLSWSGRAPQHAP
jgi:hypothetical protein